MMILDQGQVSFDENNGLQGGATFSLTHSHQDQMSLMRAMVCKEEVAPHSHSDPPFIYWAALIGNTYFRQHQHNFGL